MHRYFSIHFAQWLRYAPAMDSPNMTGPNIPSTMVPNSPTTRMPQKNACRAICPMHLRTFSTIVERQLANSIMPAAKRFCRPALISLSM